MNDTISFSAPVIPIRAAIQSKWEQEYAAFRKLLPQLLETHRGKFVAIHHGQVVDTGDDKVVLALRVLATIGNMDIHVGLVTDEANPIARSGIRREIPVRGGGV